MDNPLFNQQPYVPEAEQSVLGALILDNSTWDSEIAGNLSDTDFYTQDHQIIFRAIEQLAAASQPFDVVTVTERITAAGERNQEFLAYVGEIANNTPAAANIAHYARLVKEKSRLRALSRIGFECTRQACEHGADSTLVLEKIEQRLFVLGQKQNSREFVDVNQCLRGVLDAIERNFESDSSVTGIPTGLNDLDAITGGFEPGNLIVIAGRPSMGKTALALGLQNAVLRNVRYQHQTVQTFSMEMSATELMQRYLAQFARLSVKALKQGQLASDEE